MKKLTPQMKLLLRLAIVILIVIPAGIFLPKEAENASADSGLPIQLAEGQITSEINSQMEEEDLSATEGDLGPAATEEVLAGPETDGESADIPGASLTEDIPDDSLIEEDLTGCDANGVLPEDEDSEYASPEDVDYRTTQEYFNSLLVTSEEFYNAEVVAGAQLPTESNDARYEYITGRGYKAYKTTNMPEGFKNDAQASSQMVTFDVPVWKMDSKGNRYSDLWEITINSKLADSIRCIFSDIYLLDIKFPFNYLKGYMYRKVGGSGLVNSKLMSAHSFGVAVDINYWDADNDYYLGKGNDLRDKSNPFCIPDEVIEIFEKYGWNWGGNFDICSDTMHFQYFGLEFLQYDKEEPFPILSMDAEDMVEKYVLNLQQRLKKLGYLKKLQDGFNAKVDKAVKDFQKAYELEPTGIVDYNTWVPLINATHDMSYVF